MADEGGALFALLNAQTQLAGRVYDGKVPDTSGGAVPPMPYVVLYAQNPHAAVNNLTGQSGQTDSEHRTTTVGQEADSVRIFQGYVKAALLDVTPTVAGRQAFPIRHAFSNPVTRDDDVKPPLMYATDGWSLSTTPA